MPDKFLFFLLELLHLEGDEQYILNKFDVPLEMIASALHNDVTESILLELSLRMLNQSVKHHRGEGYSVHYSICHFLSVCICM